VSFCQIWCMDKLGGLPLLPDTVYKSDVFYDFSQVF
jgi:hypothetical protein